MAGRDVFTIFLSSKSARPDVTPEWLTKVAAAITIQLQRDFATDYGLALWTMTTTPIPGSYSLVVADTPPDPNIDGYHYDLGGTPEGFAFTVNESLDMLSVTISHEALEMVRDIDAQGYRLGASGLAYADEACDAVEDTSYAIDGVHVSNFVLPSWYIGGSKGPWDHLGVLSGPMEKTPGGYTIQLRNGQVGTDPPEAARKTAAKAHPASRTSRRLARCV